MAATNSLVLANNDIIYLWWKLPKQIKGCLGFTIHRVVNGKEEKKGLYATVGFDVKKDKRKSPQTTDEWPVQSFNWKDLYAPHNKKISYHIYPMTGTWDKLVRNKTAMIATTPVMRTQEYGNIKVIFNRGILSTQAFAKSGKPGEPVNRDEAHKMITDPSSTWRKRLAGQMLYNVYAFFNKVKENGGGKYYAALYELTDSVLIKHLTQNKNTEVILSNANQSKEVTVDGKKKTVVVDDGTNAETRKALKKAKNFTLYDRMLGTHIGHNKFVIYADAQGTPKAVLTGSTNWTATGLCGQTNNMVIIESAEVAGQYMNYWQQLKLDLPFKQGKDLRDWCRDNSKIVKINKGNVKLWYSPNTKQKTKPAKTPASPVDMKDVFDLISKAKHAVLYLLFNPGAPSIIDAIKDAAAKRPKSNPLFVRGAISDAKIADKVSTNIISSDINETPATYITELVTGVAAIPGSFGYFEEELLKLGFATIHDKLLVIDPFSENCTVITGSHNLGYTASYKNDENMLIIRKDKAIAQAYAAHVLDIVNHFKWRYKLQAKIKKAGLKTKKAKEEFLKKTWGDLDEKDTWMKYYFGTNGFIQRDKFLL